MAAVELERTPIASRFGFYSASSFLCEMHMDVRMPRAQDAQERPSRLRVKSFDFEFFNRLLDIS